MSVVSCGRLPKFIFRTASFDTTTITNRDGFTGRDYSLETNNYRVAIIGDSFVEAYGVDDRSRFSLGHREARL
jgi:hypothetical protein